MGKSSAQSDRRRPRAVRYHPLVIVLAAVCTGIAGDRLAGAPTSVWLLATATAGMLWLPLRWRRWDRLAGIVLLAAVASWGAAWHHLHWNAFRGDDLGHFGRREPQPVCLEAVAIKGPRRLPAPRFDPMRIIPQGDRTQVEIEVLAIRDGADWRPASGKTRLTVEGHLLGVRAGDRLEVFGHVSANPPAVNPGGFDYAARERSDRRLCQVRSAYPDCVTVTRRAKLGTPRVWVQWARSAGDRILGRFIGRDRAGLAAAVLLGAREEVELEQARAFMETGTVHLLAISGLHVGIVAAALGVALRFLLVRPSRTAVTVALVTTLYALLADARPSAVRAAVLVVVFCAATCLGRPRLDFNSLAAAGLAILAWNPTHLFGTGAQLSFLSVAGLMWFAPYWFATSPEEERLRRLIWESRDWPDRLLWLCLRSLRSLTLVSAVLWMLNLPLVTARFHLLPPGAILLNTLLWIPMAAALASGLGVLLFGWFVPPVAAVFGWCCDASLWVVESGVELARVAPCSHFWVPGPADWWILGFYGGLGLAAACPAIRPPRRWCLALLAGWMAVGLVPSMLREREGRLQCTVLSVGHGCAVVLELPSGQTMLYDAGQFGSPSFGARSIARHLWSRGRTHLDAVVLSHADADHYNALPELFDYVSVGVVYVSEVMFQRNNAALDALSEAIEARQVPLREIRAGDRLEGGEGCLVEVAHPPDRWVLGSDNANSVVLAVEYRGRRILLPGDLEPPGLDSLLAEEPWDCDVLLAPHHGSRGSNPPGLAAWASPEWVVASGGFDDCQPATTQAYRAIGAEVLHTAETGAVSVSIDGSRFVVTSFLKSR